MRIYLVGFMGSGKSTLGTKAAAFFDVPLLDTDQEIETVEHKSIKDIFSSDGENHFRKIEQVVLHQTTKFNKAVVATGGGLPCFNNNMEWINKNGISIYLQWPLELLKQNVLSQREMRPLLSSLSEKQAELKFNELLTMRIPFYEQAAITIEMTGDQEIDEAVLIKACKYIW